MVFVVGLRGAVGADYRDISEPEPATGLRWKRLSEALTILVEADAGAGGPLGTWCCAAASPMPGLAGTGLG